MQCSHRTLFLLSGGLWLAVGTYLLALGLKFLFNSHNFARDDILFLLQVAAMLGGYFKGRLLLTRSVNREVKRIATLPNPTGLKNIYSWRYYLLFLSMMGLGFILRLFSLPLLWRGLIDIAIGTALIQGARTYFRYFSKAPKASPKDIFLDETALKDDRAIEFCLTGLLDNRLVIPRFLVHEQTAENVHKLESATHLHVRFTDLDFPELTDRSQKMVKLGTTSNATIFTADAQFNPPAVKVIHLHKLANLLKPLMNKGERLRIKIQRQGKEATQGVGYLDDGTMVVVNGGGEYLGETIETHVVSIKHTSAGRMIFCNVVETSTV